MASFVTEYKHLEIQLEDIISATNNFDENKVIGRGGFGKVYAGELSHSQSGEKSLVAIKRLDRRYGQGDTEFFKEIRMLSCYRHENLISLLGFCCQGGEMILIYEYASGGSLDRLLSSAALTWTQRLRICIEAAKGLSFLHDPNGTQQRVLHCDIKSANILLDKNMTAKVSDFGLSKMGPANQQYSLLITGALGTPGYCDPVFMETYSLTKESDVYSFGIVLLEVLCGKLCVEYSKDQIKVIRVPMWKQSYEEKNLNEIVFQNLMKQADPSSLNTFSDIAFQCIRKAREERPTMSRVVEELEIALESQEFPDLRLRMLSKYQDILMAVDPLFIYKTGKQLKELLSKGLIISEGKKWLSITEKGEHIERIYIQACLNPDEIDDDDFQHLSDDIVNSRFPGGRCFNYNYRDFVARVRGEYLTPQISYMVNLVFRYIDQSEVNRYNPLRYKVDGENETKISVIYPSTHLREDGWFVVPLYRFTSQHTTVDLLFEFEDPATDLEVAGMEFQPSEEKVELQVFEEYQHIIKAASQSLAYRSLEELKQILRLGIYLKDYTKWFSLNEKEEHCEMISIEDCLVPNEDFTNPSEPSILSRFPTGFYSTYKWGFKIHVKTELLSPLITYTMNIVFDDWLNRESEYVELKYRLKDKGETTTFTVNLANKRKADMNWFIVELYRFNSDGSIVDIEIDFENHVIDMRVEGISFEPLEKFCLNEKGQHIERISIEACLNPDTALYSKDDDEDWVNSRFPGGPCYEYISEFKACVRGQYLTPHISYKLNLVFRYRWKYHVNEYKPLRYKIDGEDETKALIIYPSTHLREDGWFVVPLYQFTSQHNTTDLQFEFDQRPRMTSILIAGIVFQPFEEKVELQVFEEYQHIVEAASQSLFYTSLDELRQILTIGIYLKDYTRWFSLNEKGEHCEMISIEDCLVPNEDVTPRYKSHEYSRFPAGLYDTEQKGFKTHVKTQLLNPSMRYTVNLVFKVTSEQYHYVDLKYRLSGEPTTSTVYLADWTGYDHLHIAELYEFTSNGGIVDLEIDFGDLGTNIDGVEGILFQPSPWNSKTTQTG